MCFTLGKTNKQMVLWFKKLRRFLGVVKFCASRGRHVTADRSLLRLLESFIGALTQNISPAIKTSSVVVFNYLLAVNQFGIESLSASCYDLVETRSTERRFTAAGSLGDLKDLML